MAKKNAEKPVVENDEITDLKEDNTSVDNGKLSENADPNLYVVEAADLNQYPELSQQGAQLYDKVLYGSLWVDKYTTSSKESYVREAWPRKIHEVGNPLTIKPQ